MLAECVSQLDEPFRRSEIIGWFRRHHPDVNETTLAAHIQAATTNAANHARNNPLGSRAPLLRRVDHGLYVRAAHAESAAIVPVRMKTLSGCCPIRAGRCRRTNCASTVPQGSKRQACTRGG